MSKRRLAFSKLNMAKYISHLDLLRCFTRAIMRAELPVVYSQGFNPHQKMTFSLPLSVGVTSVCEFADVEFEDGISDAEIMERLNRTLPPDIRILSVGDPKISANDIFAAEYKVTLLSDNLCAEAPDACKRFFAQPEVTIIKRTKKKGEKEVNLMDFVKSAVGFRECSEGAQFSMTLSAGGQKNLKPEIAVEALIDYLKSLIDINIAGYNIHRTKILYDKNNPKEFN